MGMFKPATAWQTAYLSFCLRARAQCLDKGMTRVLLK